MKKINKIILTGIFAIICSCAPVNLKKVSLQGDLPMVELVGKTVSMGHIRYTFKVRNFSLEEKTYRFVCKSEDELFSEIEQKRFQKVVIPAETEIKLIHIVDKRDIHGTQQCGLVK